MTQCSVVLAKAMAYDEAAAETVRALLAFPGNPFAPGVHVLVKPNLLRADILACTNATIIAALATVFISITVILRPSV